MRKIALGGAPTVVASPCGHQTKLPRVAEDRTTVDGINVGFLMSVEHVSEQSLSQRRDKARRYLL